MDCLFCKIVEGVIPSKKVYEDEFVYAFEDVNPAAKVHVLIVPKAHIADINAVNSENSAIIEKIFIVIPKIASELGLESGYRVVTNVGEHGQQSVHHLHFHLIGGQQLKWEFV